MHTERDGVLDITDDETDGFMCCLVLVDCDRLMNTAGCQCFMLVDEFSLFLVVDFLNVVMLMMEDFFKFPCLPCVFCSFLLLVRSSSVSPMYAFSHALGTLGIDCTCCAVV